MCGSVQDCGDALNYPWQFSMEEQRRTGGFIASIVEFLVRFRELNRNVLLL